MCGITGWVSFDRDLTAASSTLDAMTETMSCRGPDDRGTWTGGPAGLGHRRLAIIDLPGGRQPMTAETPNGTVALVYSGETYNYTELRRELAGRGHRFTTESDTEVVLRGYLEWGEALAERLNGMYAFAIWDARHDKLVMVRDRMGIKPFYCYETSDGVLFGSEPKAILANPLARRRVGVDGLRELFSMVKTPGHAIWDGMREIEPGTVVTVDRSGLRGRVYWELETRPHTDGREASIARCASSWRTSWAGSSFWTCRAASCSPAASTPRRSRGSPPGSSPRRARRCAASPSTSSARPTTSSPTRCGPRRTPRTCTTSRRRRAPGTVTSSSTPTRSPIPTCAPR
ncbi:Amidophosphoribosyltransferase [Streptomyces alboniger]